MALEKLLRRPAGATVIPRSVRRARSKFLHYFPGGFRDPTYIAWERGYKWDAHLAWREAFGSEKFSHHLREGNFEDIARAAVGIESRTNLLFSFEKMALRDAVKSPAGSKAFSRALFDLLHGEGALQTRFDAWVAALATLPRRQTRVLTWPLATVFGFIAQPKQHFFLKPLVTRRAAEAYGQPLDYASRPSAETYAGLLKFARQVRADLTDLRPRDMIDIQSFLWVQGSDEYP